MGYHVSDLLIIIDLFLKRKKNIVHPYSSGWWFQPLSKMMEFVSWDDDIPSIWKNKIHVPNHQSVIHIY